MSDVLEADAGPSGPRPDAPPGRQPQVDRAHRAGRQPVSRDGTSRVGYRVAVVTILGAIAATLVAWVAFLVYATTWLVGLSHF
jgi:hypothetical protein